MSLGPRPLLTVLAWILAGAALVRAATGVRAGLAYSRALGLAPTAGDTASPELLAPAAVGFNRFDVLWLMGETGLGVADRLKESGRPLGEVEHALADAAANYLRAACESPASSWPWNGLASAYGRAELAERPARPVDLGWFGTSAWAFVGRPGRVAIGLARKAIEREPSIPAYRDDLVNLALDLGLPGLAEEAIREAARVQPAHNLHTGLDWNTLPKGLQEAFLEASRESLGKAPMLSRERHLLHLGQLARRLDRLEEAEGYLRAALEAAPGPLNRAEDAYHLALVLVDRKDYAGAARALDTASTLPVFEVPAKVIRARIAEAEGRPEDALQLFQDAARLQPRNVELALECSRIARQLSRFKTAEESLRWAIVVAPADPRPYGALVETLLRQGNPEAAKAVLRDMRRAFGDTAQVARVQKEIESAAGATRP